MVMHLCSAPSARMALPRKQPRAGLFCQASSAVPSRDQQETPRRNALLMVAAPLFLTAAAQAKDPEEARKAKEARLAQLRNAADEMKATGKGETAFPDSEYAVSEDKTPNIHTRQEEGLRKGK